MRKGKGREEGLSFSPQSPFPFPTFSPFHNGHLSTTAIFFGGQSIDSLLFQPLYKGPLSIMATFLCLEGGHCREVQLYFSAYPINFSFCKVLKYQQAIASLPTFKLFWNGQVPYYLVLNLSSQLYAVCCVYKS